MRLPADLASDGAQTLYFLCDEVEAADKATAALLGDVRFEHLDRAEDKVRRFMAECWADRSTDHVPLFVASHSAEVRKATCYIPVEFLWVTSVAAFPGVRLLPVDDPQVPPSAPWFLLEKPTGCVAAVEVEGSSFARMADRARDRVNHLLRAVRIAQSAHVQDFQLRFRIGIGYAFDDRLRGWNRRDDEAYELMLTEQIAKELLSHPALSVPVSERSDIEEKAALAMGWMERACLTGDNLIAMLYRFFGRAALGEVRLPTMNPVRAGRPTGKKGVCERVLLGAASRRPIRHADHPGCHPLPSRGLQRRLRRPDQPGPGDEEIRTFTAGLRQALADPGQPPTGNCSLPSITAMTVTRCLSCAGHRAHAAMIAVHAWSKRSWTPGSSVT